MKRFVLAITGASGSPFGIRVLEELSKTAEVHLVISSNSFSIIRDETGLDWAEDTENTVRKHCGSDRIFFYADRHMEAPIASGSFRTDGMMVVPCSMKTLSGIAAGYAANLIERAADVTMKERRSLLLSPREMPFSAIHLENMLKLARIGVTIAPPVPAFYHKPAGLEEMVDFIAGKILDTFGVEHTLFKRWGS
ncbi:MAG: UbiX family flavin prenyltransferase [Alphaproteobacteria bacterium]|uniref:Flavin prenyltransferase UbiX n=1 Tax=Candidatus Nitrobium versatile TaxID=2884831 RepID=A0A953J8R9_9BACT|nr:UbiX family flavin prenyltransferase [Candidatus Nitrobium versatile]